MSGTVGNPSVLECPSAEGLLSNVEDFPSMSRWRPEGGLVVVMTRPCVLEKVCNYTRKLTINQCIINELHRIRRRL